MKQDRTSRIGSAHRGRLATILVALLAVAGFVACDSTGPGETARIQVQLTDAPVDNIESARVWISRVYLQGGDDDDADDAGEGEDDDDGSGRIDLFDDTENPQEYDLLDLQNGVVANLTDPVEIESGMYGQLRLVVDRAEITLVDGFTFADGSSSTELFVPSGAQSGIKVQLAEPIDAAAGELTVVLVDFDVARNFVFQGPPDAPNGVLFTPTLVQIEPDDAN